MKNFYISLGEPRVIVQGAVGDQEWGHYQFPNFRRSRKGGILAYWGYGSDTIHYGKHDGGIKGPFVSYDHGETWGPVPEDDTAGVEWTMPDGKVFLGFCSDSAHKMTKEWWDQYTPYAAWGDGFRMYFAEDFGKNENAVVKARIFDPNSGETEEYEPVINWPHAPITCYPGDHIYPLSQTFALSNRSIILRDGVFYMSMYMYGFDSTAKTREDALNPYNRYYSVYVFKSDDCARTWNFLSQVPVTEETFNPERGFEGFCEPQMDRMPDGSFVMLIRTGGILPSYIVRSEDGCRTWSKPVQFDDCGVLPQILSLPCGVTLAGYGRPVLRLRATSDPAGLQWEDPITIALPEPENNEACTHKTNVSCFYTNFIPLDACSALWVYTEFQRPNADGQPAKAVIARKITVEGAENICGIHD